MSDVKVLQYLQDHNTLTLATASPAGIPHAATMLFVSDEMSLYLWSGPGSTTVRNIERNPLVAVTINNDDPSGTTGIQAQGICSRVVDTAEIDRVIKAFSQKFSQAGTDAADGLLFFRVDPSHLSFISGNSAMTPGAGLGCDYKKTVAFSVFKDLPERRADVVAGQLQSMRASAGDIIVREGTPAEMFFIIVEGEVEVVQGSGDAERPFARLGNGQFFGEIAILRDTPRTATVRAIVDTTLLKMARDDFKQLMAQSLATTQDFDQLIRERLEALAVGPSLS